MGHTKKIFAKKTQKLFDLYYCPLIIFDLDFGHLVKKVGTERQRDLERQRDGVTQRDRETERQRDRETERQRDRETKRQRDKETERQRPLERQKDNHLFHVVGVLGFGVYLSEY